MPDHTDNRATDLTSPDAGGTEELRRRIEAGEAENFTLRQALAERDRQLDDMRASTSWRATALLRTLGGWLRRKGAVAPGRPHRNLRTFVIGTAEYQRWLGSYSQVDAAMAARLAAHVPQLSARPLISVIMPTYNVDPPLLRAAIDSVRRQIYPHWELCISDDASTLAGTRALLESCAAEDARIRVNLRTTNGHISANSNSALDLATGDFVALMDADDLIPEDALFWVAHEIALHPDADMLFSDEDKLDAAGRRFDPYFKPAWNPALMQAQNAFCHLGVFRRGLVEKVGRFREGYEGAQDHDLALRCADESAPARIRHIPRVLYHWRVLPGSTAGSLSAKPYAANAGQRAVQDHLDRRGIKGRVVTAAASFYQVSYVPPDPCPHVSIIMPTTLRNAIATRCIAAILDKTRYSNFELVLVLNEKDAGALARLPQDARLRTQTYSAETFNYSTVNNLGVAQTRGDLVCFLNDDIEPITPEWLDLLVARVSLEGVAAAGPMLYYPSGLIQHAGVLLGVGGVADHAFRNEPRGQTGYFARAALEQDFSALTAACLLVRRAAFESAGRFDAALPSAFNDIDLCIRLRRAGHRIVWTPAAQMIHHESVTFGAPDSSARTAQYERDIAAMRERWGAILDSDPCYNPNLSLDHRRQFQLTAPPRVRFEPGAPVSRTALLP